VPPPFILCAGVTATVTLLLIDPPSPEQVSVNNVSAVRSPMASLPALPLSPVHPSEATQVVEKFVSQVRVTESPEGTEAALLLKVSSGGRGAGPMAAAYVE